MQPVAQRLPDMHLPDVWPKRYSECLQPEEIRRRAAVPARELGGLDALCTEQACELLKSELERVFVVTDTSAAIIRAEVERAVAHATTTYSDRKTVLGFAYDFPSLDSLPEPYAPTIVTGLDGAGKSAIRKAVGRVLSGRTAIALDPSHPSVPLIDFATVTVSGHRSVGGILRQLASPEIAAGSVRISEGHLALECARWQRMCGTCLFGVDEMQFLTQSASASTLVTRTLLQLAEVRVPWFFVANYSLCHRLLRRPAEAVQRLLVHPKLVLPDAPDSADWGKLIAAYATVCGHYFDFQFVERGNDLWKRTAGNKRTLRMLVVHAYRLSRERGSTKATWVDVESAYASGEFFAPRRDVELLTAHAGQGGKLREDLSCPFIGSEIREQLESYAKALRDARKDRVNAAVMAASLNAKERALLDQIARNEGSPQEPKSGKVITLPRRRKRKTMAALQEAGRRHLEALGISPPPPES